MSKPAEKDLGPPIVAWLERDGWEAYHEVKFRPVPGGPIWIIDIVATRGAALAVFELKNSLSWDVVAQARRALPHAHRVYVVVPAEKDRAAAPSEGRKLAHEVCEGFGIGVLQVRPESKTEQLAAMRTTVDPADRVSVHVQAHGQGRSDVSALFDVLREEHKSGEFSAAGTRNGPRVSKTELIFKAIRNYLADHGGSAPFADVRIVAGVSERTLASWTSDERISRVQLDRRETAWVLRLVEPGQEEPVTVTSHKSHPRRWIPA